MQHTHTPRPNLIKKQNGDSIPMYIIGLYISKNTLLLGTCIHNHIRMTFVIIKMLQGRHPIRIIENNDICRLRKLDTIS